jgi:hypothetical protein
MATTLSARTGGRGSQASCPRLLRIRGVKWQRQGFQLYWRLKSRPRLPGRPPLDLELRTLIRRMARENPTWGRRRIQAELRFLGYEVAELTVAKYMRHPSPRPSSTWQAFLEVHTLTIEWSGAFGSAARMRFVTGTTAGPSILGHRRSPPSRQPRRNRSAQHYASHDTDRRLVGPRSVGHDPPYVFSNITFPRVAAAHALRRLGGARLALTTPGQSSEGSTSERTVCAAWG